MSWNIYWAQPECWRSFPERVTHNVVSSIYFHKSETVGTFDSDVQLCIPNAVHAMYPRIHSVKTDENIKLIIKRNITHTSFEIQQIVCLLDDDEAEWGTSLPIVKICRRGTIGGGRAGGGHVSGDSKAGGGGHVSGGSVVCIIVSNMSLLLKLEYVWFSITTGEILWYFKKKGINYHLLTSIGIISIDQSWNKTSIL